MSRFSLDIQREIIIRADHDGVKAAARLYKLQPRTVRELRDNRVAIMAPPLQFQLRPGEKISNLTDYRKF